MEYKALGKTGLKVSKVGFGGIPVQRINGEETRKVVLKAEELGINFLDSARAYTVSEEYIGAALEGRRDKWIIATKSPAKDYAGMGKDIEISLANFKTDFIDLYQLHNVKTPEEYQRVMSEDGAYKALLDAKKAGKIGHIGMTTHSLDMLRIYIESGKFETVMFPYNIVETQAFDLFQRAKELNVGVIAMKPLAGGALEDGTMAMKFILENDSISIAIPGMATIAEVEENAAVANNFVPLTFEEREKALMIAKALGNNFCRRCNYCAPCPQGIDIPSCFLFQGYRDRYDLKAWSESRYFSLSKRAKDCVKCGACETRCPYNLPIREMLKKVRKSFNE